MQTHELVFTFPLPRTHTGVALGNGGMGALIWSPDGGILALTVSRNDFWDRRFGGRLPPGVTYGDLKKMAPGASPEQLTAALSPNVRDLYAQGARPSSLLPCGRFDLRLADGVSPRVARLDPAVGQLTIDFEGTRATVSFIMSPETDVLMIQDPGALLQDIRPRPAWEWCRDEFRRRGFAEPAMLGSPGITGWVQACPADPALCTMARTKGTETCITLALADTSDAAINKAEAILANSVSWSEMLNRSEVWWKDYWGHVPDVVIPDAFFTDFLIYAHWKFGCATNPTALRPAPLQGPWIEEYQFPPWGGDYTVNVNIQQIYTLAFCGGNHHHIMPLFDLLESGPFLETMRHNARTLLGIEDGLLLTHTVNDEGRQCQLGFSPHSALDQAVTAWLAHLYWLYYQHTGDLSFLQTRAVPFMRGVLRVYDAMLEEADDGSLRLPLSVSPEYGVSGFIKHRQDGPNASFQLTCIHTLVNDLTSACRDLGEEPEPRWLVIRQHLPRFTTIRGRDGVERIAIWEGQDLEVCHRHHSHLGCIYPMDLSADLTPEEHRALANGMEHWLKTGMGTWSEWAFPWAAIIEARLGLREAPWVLLNIWKSVFINEGMTTVYLPRFHGITAHRYDDIDAPKASHEIMQLEGTCAGATAIFEMLVHTHGGTLYVFPSTPASWRDVSFCNVPQPGGLSVSAKQAAGQIREIHITAARPIHIRLDVPGVTSMHRTDNGTPVALPLVIDLAAGESLHLS